MKVLAFSWSFSKTTEWDFLLISISRSYFRRRNIFENCTIFPESPIWNTYHNFEDFQKLTLKPNIFKILVRNLKQDIFFNQFVKIYIQNVRRFLGNFSKNSVFGSKIFDYFLSVFENYRRVFCRFRLAEINFVFISS